METITLQYNPNSNFAIALINLIKASDEVTVIESKPASKKRARKTGIERAIEDFKNGNTVKCKDFDDYLQKVNS